MEKTFEKQLSYEDRMPHCKNVIAKKLLEIMLQKKTNLALSADVATSHDLLMLADQCGPDICVLKTHIDMIEDFTPTLTNELRRLAQKHTFLLFEDRKFADIGSTVKQQYQGGIYRISDWADIINAHSLPGPGIISGLADIGMQKNRGLLLLAEMSSANNLLDSNYTQKTLELAKAFPQFVMGFIAQRKLLDDPGWVYLTPGIQFFEKTDVHGQQYMSPEEAIIKNLTDIIIVGRGIIHATNPKDEARKYREVGWEAYLRR